MAEGIRPIPASTTDIMRASMSSRRGDWGTYNPYTLFCRSSRLKTLLHSGLPAWLPTPLRTQAMRSDQPPRILWPALVRSSSPSWIRTNNLLIQSQSQLPIVLPGNGADTCPRWSALFSCKRYRHVAAPLIGLEPTIFSLRGRRALPQLHRGRG